MKAEHDVVLPVDLMVSPGPCCSGVSAFLESPLALLRLGATCVALHLLVRSADAQWASFSHTAFGLSPIGTHKSAISTFASDFTHRISRFTDDTRTYSIVRSSLLSSGCTMALQVGCNLGAAMKAACAHGYGTVQLAPGCYELSHTLHVPDALSIRGGPSGTVTIKNNEYGSPVIHFEASLTLTLTLIDYNPKVVSPLTT